MPGIKISRLRAASSLATKLRQKDDVALPIPGQGVVAIG